MNKRLFNTAIVMHGGSSYRSILHQGLLQAYFVRVLRQLGTYAKNSSVPFLTAHEDLPSLAWIRHASAPWLQDLVKPLTEEVALAPAIRMALGALPAGEPGLITIVSDFHIIDVDEVTQLVDQILKHRPLTFLKLVFAAGECQGNDILPLMLEERPGGRFDMVDTLFATRLCGQGESIEENFDRKLSVVASLVSTGYRP